MSVTPMTPHAQDELAREYAKASPARRGVIYHQWKARYGEDTAYELVMAGRAFIVYPEHPADFRASWGQPTGSRADICAAVLTLSDEQLESVSASLRRAFLKHADELWDVWALAVQMAGVA
ncbi:hypothetical protein GCM10008955_00740 [Deinococcus malanensis]|uniref:Uncharacterized protein n=1 Tax=Deinococcus malanensis TaxID=1706855 RepID=A0ABQ2EH18_9DEIO|nr:hypothetical protein [Deinococcus malanensis]GGK11369.1 hypothetical protein GCM10008955_00740 [Deinococcus malanensis]